MSMMIYITRAPTDPICPRVSVGGNETIGYYCTFRGKAADCITVLREALKAMETAAPELDSLPVDRRYKELGAS